MFGAYYKFMTVVLDQQGTLELPEAVRQALHLALGSELEIFVEDGGIRLKAPRGELIEENGMLFWSVNS
jgi:bifunctional DNA-binding transcriptional regulator/antitoxin component of YhaV-PrlF toxin-antitoxin module